MEIILRSFTELLDKWDGILYYDVNKMSYDIIYQAMTSHKTFEGNL